MKAILLHLSDIHITNTNNQILKHGKEIAVCTFSSLHDASSVFILISGDIAFSGKQAQYELATQLLNEIKSHIQNEKSGIPIHFVIAPGNHDCDFDQDSQMRQIAIRSLVSGAESIDNIDNSVISQCISIQNQFFDFRNSLESGSQSKDDGLWKSNSYEIDGKIIVFDAINLSWVSQKVEELGGIAFPIKRYLEKEHEQQDLRITVMHHPMNWIGNGYRDFRKYIRKLSSIIITGHEHQPNHGINNDTESMESVFIEGAVLQEKIDMSNSSFNLITIDLEESSYKVDQFKWKSIRYEPIEEGSWSGFNKLPSKYRNPFEIQPGFRNRLNDPGANFKLVGCEQVTLQDIYVYPDMTEVGKDRSPSSFMSTSLLLEPSRTAKGILLSGEEKVGGSSLLYRLYDEYHERGFVPLYLNGTNLKHSTPRDIEAYIKNAVTQQYGKEAIVPFNQHSVNKKILLLDDFDDCASRSLAVQTTVLNTLRKQFGHIVVTVGELFEVKELLSKAQINDISEFTHFKMQPFGYSLRHKLIKRWMLLSNSNASEANIIAKIDQAEKAMDAVMNSNLIPAMPLYLLTLLQINEAGRSGEFKDSALGHYYNYLLHTGFTSANIEGDKLNMMFDYCTEMAWHFHINKCDEMSRQELKAFNDYYEKKYTTVDFNEQINNLINSHVLVHRGDEYFYFRYPYSYYFLKGRYLSRHLREEPIREYIKKCSQNLYVRDNANTLLFLAHHSNDSIIVDTIISSLKKLFDHFSPITFNNDTNEIAILIRDAASLKLKLIETSPTVVRERVNHERDEHIHANGDDDGLVEAEENGGTLSLIAQLVTLFKTIEILGQILKNQNSSLTRERKGYILNELFAGPMRALASFYNLITQNPEQLITEIDTALKERHKLDDHQERKRIATQIAARLIQVVSFGFIFKASSSVNSEPLHEHIHSVVDQNPTPANQLIELGVLLDSPKPLPRKNLISLSELVSNNVVALSMIQMHVIRRLYMFDTTHEDKQWLSSKLQINLEFQQALDFNSSNAKRVK